VEPTLADIKTRVRQFVTATFYVPAPSQLTDAQSLLDSGIVDSTGVLEIIGFLQAEFGVNVEDDEILPENLDSVERLAVYIERKRNETAAA